VTWAYYNEIDPFAVDTLRTLIARELIAPGEVDDRSIEDVSPDDLRGFTQCHFFAGLGLWSAAARRAGWGDDRPVWTASCPCQPFSEAGAGAGFADERHLWPSLHWLIQQRRPAIIFGEQVASAEAKPWLDLVCDDLAGVGYATRAQVAAAACYGAPMRRERLYWMADRDGGGQPQGRARDAAQECCWPSGSGAVDGLGSAERARLEGLGGDGADASDRPATGRPAATTSDVVWLQCGDGKQRPIASGIAALAHGLPKRVDDRYAWAGVVGDLANHLKRAKRYRVGSIRALGNAIVLPQATEWMRLNA
jgi:DNA (cytosine-5)-methyltransferase 1